MGEFRHEMNLYELKQARELLVMVRTLTMGHIPAIYTNNYSHGVIEAIKQIDKDIKKKEGVK